MQERIKGNCARCSRYIHSALLSPRIHVAVAVSHGVGSSSGFRVQMAAIHFFVTDSCPLALDSGPWLLISML
jgi:hypothetical protein